MHNTPTEPVAAAAVQPILAITFTRGELHLLSWLEGADGIPGEDLDPTGELTPDGRALLIAAAERSLRARELAWLDDDGNLLLDETLMTMMLACVRAERSLAIVHVAPDSLATDMYAHLKDGAAVLHTQFEPGLHTLSMFETPQDLLAVVRDMCGLTGLRPAQHTVTVDADKLAQATSAAAADDVEQAHALIGAAGNAAAAALATALAGPHRTTIITRWEGTQPQERPQQVTVMVSDQGTWKLQGWPPVEEGTPPSSPGPIEVTLAPASDADLDEFFSGWLVAEPLAAPHA